MNNNINNNNKEILKSLQQMQFIFMQILVLEVSEMHYFGVFFHTMCRNAQREIPEFLT